MLIVVFFFSYSINVTNETFSIVSSSNADSVLFHENGGDSSRSSVPNSEFGTTLLSHEDILCDSNCPSSASITEASPGDMTTSTSSIEKKRVSKKNGRSDIWKYFDVFAGSQYKDYAFCAVCQSEVYYTMTMSTGMLTRHLKKFHREEYNSMVELQTTKKHKVDSVDLSQVSLSKFLVGAPSFEGALLTWMIDTYQPISACEHPSFRAMVQSLNPKAQVVGREKLKAMIAKQYALVKLKFKSILKGIPFSCTTDAWTSCSNVTYMTCTVHFIDRSTWQLNRFSLGIFEKTGTSKAEDVVSYVEKMWSQFDLEYSSCTAIVTDTEATMCKAGRLFCQAASRNGGDLAWHGCVDHLLELVTGVALKDYPESAGAMQAARDLVSFFSSSSQASDTLLSLQ